MIGTVKKWLADKQFGFIEDSEGGSDVFVHKSALPKHLSGLERGQRVIFEAIETAKGKKAVECRLADI